MRRAARRAGVRRAWVEARSAHRIGGGDGAARFVLATAPPARVVYPRGQYRLMLPPASYSIAFCTGHQPAMVWTNVKTQLTVARRPDASSRAPVEPRTGRASMARVGRCSSIRR